MSVQFSYVALYAPLSLVFDDLTNGKAVMRYSRHRLTA